LDIGHNIGRPFHWWRTELGLPSIRLGAERGRHDNRCPSGTVAARRVPLTIEHVHKKVPAMAEHDFGTGMRDFNEADHTLLAVINERTGSTNAKLDEIKLELDEFVTRVEFQPVKLLVFGLVGLILSGVFAAIIAMVVSARHI
jgi:hypothetical protein